MSNLNPNAMVNTKSQSVESVPCDFCNEQTAVLYCRADSAKLCLLCDQHVHSANLLSRKHLRSQICDNCSSNPVSVRCNTDNLCLCHDCDWDAHSTSSLAASHHRTPLGGFTGCPSSSHLASLWGFHFHTNKSHQSWDDYRHSLTPLDSWLFKSDSDAISLQLQDLMVPTHNATFYPPLNEHSPCCGKHKHVIHKQLLQLLKRDLAGDADAGTASITNANDGENRVPVPVPVPVPEAPSKSSGLRQGSEQAFGLGNGVHVFPETAPAAVTPQPLQQQQEPVNSFLVMPSNLDPKEGHEMVDRKMLWHDNPNGQAVQVTITS